MSSFFRDPASVVGIKRADAKTDGLADRIFSWERVFDFGLEDLDQSLEDAALTTLLVVSEGVKVLAGNGFFVAKGKIRFGSHSRLREDGLNIHSRNRLGTALALTSGNESPFFFRRGSVDFSHHLSNRGVLHRG